jgi:hypothetical protein
MANLSTRAKFHDAFWRLCGNISTDAALIESGEAVDEVADQCLTHGIWQAQRFLVDAGYNGWVARSTAVTSWTGTDAANGGRYTAVPTDATHGFLRLAGDYDRSSLVKANGDPWGCEVSYDQRSAKGDGYYLKNDQVWLLRTASVPSTIYIEYHQQHVEFAATTFDAGLSFPVDVRMLVVAYGAQQALDEGWLPIEDPDAIREAIQTQERRARDFARRSHAVRHVRQRPRLGNHYY